MDELGITSYTSTEWRLFIHSSNRSLKYVLYHYGNLFGAVPISLSVYLREEYEDIKRAIDLLQYHMYQWIICVHFKTVRFLLGQQNGYIKCSFLCTWGSRALEKHLFQSKWPPRSDLKPGDRYILHHPLVDRKNTIFSSLYIKLGLMKCFVKAFSTEGVDCFKYLILKFPNLPFGKINTSVFHGSSIRQLIGNEHFIETMTELKNALFSLKEKPC